MFYIYCMLMSILKIYHKCATSYVKYSVSLRRLQGCPRHISTNPGKVGFKMSDDNRINAEEERKKKIKKVAVGVGIGVGVAAGAAAAVVAAPLVIAGAGFTATGVLAGSMAAAVQSVIGNVAAGSLFALLQSAGVAGLAASTTAAVGAAGAAVGGAATGAVANIVANKVLSSKEGTVQDSGTVECGSQTDDIPFPEGDAIEADVDVWPTGNETKCDRATQTARLANEMLINHL